MRKEHWFLIAKDLEKGGFVKLSLGHGITIRFDFETIFGLYQNSLYISADKRCIHSSKILQRR
jgi:hypothetical protein